MDGCLRSASSLSDGNGDANVESDGKATDEDRRCTRISERVATAAARLSAQRPTTLSLAEINERLTKKAASPKQSANFSNTNSFTHQGCKTGVHRIYEHIFNRKALLFRANLHFYFKIGPMCSSLFTALTPLVR